MCNAISQLPMCVGNQIGALSQSAGDCALEKYTFCSNYLAKQVDVLRSDVLPQLCKQAHDVAREVIKNYFFVLPSLTFSYGFYTDCAISTLVTGVAFLDSYLQMQDVRESFAIFIGVPLAAHFATRLVRVVVTLDPVEAIGLIFQVASLAKLALIGRGENY